MNYGGSRDVYLTVRCEMRRRQISTRYMSGTSTRFYEDRLANLNLITLIPNLLPRSVDLLSNFQCRHSCLSAVSQISYSSSSRIQ